MAATLTQERFTGPEWIFERKYDGIRVLEIPKPPFTKATGLPRLRAHWCGRKSS
jgi:hypothetical protein